ncbi:MAG TPA: YkgJ family cysteine cluster protein [Candidatus Lokiarchaeia archaeon]|nr:YkgJ family cysteine cluster protein [Candidatus Lokiarchaeia archaeon]
MPKKKIAKDEEPSEEESSTSEEETTEKKSKFVFKCTRCEGSDPNARCCVRGDIPLCFWDLELWAKNKVVANMLSHLSVEMSTLGTFDLVIKSVPLEASESTEEGEKEPSGTEDTNSENDAGNKLMRCSFYKTGDRSCLIYDNRPLYCREFPLEYDSNVFALADLECPGVGTGPMSKEELQQIREDARLGFAELRRMRISLPILNQLIANNSIRMFLEQISKESEERMKNLSPEDRQKIDEINQKMAGGAGEPEE